MSNIWIYLVIEGVYKLTVKHLQLLQIRIDLEDPCHRRASGGKRIHMEIEEKIVYVLNRICKTKRGIYRKESDPNVRLADFK